MKVTQVAFKFLFAVSLPFFFTACTTDSDGDDFEAFADAIIIKKIVNEEAKTAIAYFVYGNNAIASATVIPPENAAGAVSLAAINDLKYDYSHEPDSGDFSLIPPVAGNYLFEIESARGDKIQQTDLLEINNMNIPEIISTSFNSSTLTLTVKWKSVSDTDGISVKLSDTSGNAIFASYILEPSATGFNIGTGGGNWISSANIGDKLNLQIQSIIIEEVADEDYSLYNITGIAIAEKAIIWGE